MISQRPFNVHAVSLPVCMLSCVFWGLVISPRYICQYEVTELAHTLIPTSFQGGFSPEEPQLSTSQPHFGVLVPCEEAGRIGLADAYGYSQFYTSVSRLHFLDFIVERNCPWFAFPVMKLFWNVIPFNKWVPRTAAKGCRYGISMFPNSFGSPVWFTDEAPKLRVVTAGFWAG